MNRQRHTNLDELRSRVAAGEYRVDPRTVADSIVRRAWVLTGAPQTAPVVPMMSHRAWRASRDTRTEDYVRAA